MDVVMFVASTCIATLLAEAFETLVSIGLSPAVLRIFERVEGEMTSMQLRLLSGIAASFIAINAMAGTLVLDGEVKPPVEITDAQFANLPRVDLEVKGQDGNVYKYSGVELADILIIAKAPIRADLKGKDIDKYIIALGADGFGAVFSLPEFDVGRFVIADKLNGQPLSVTDGPLQLISPDEPRRSRWIKQLSRITVRKALP